MELHRRNIDGHDERAVPGRRLAAGGAQNPFADLQDQAALFGDRDEDIGRDGAALGMLPAQQRLEAEDLAGRQVLLRLIGEAQFAARNRMQQIVLDDAAAP